MQKEKSGGRCRGKPPTYGGMLGVKYQESGGMEKD
jgi:hypothetical protein